MKDNQKLYKITAALLVDGKGIMAADESIGTVGKRLDQVGLPNQAGNRQDFREILFTAPGIEEYISGVIMYDSSIRNFTDAGVAFPDVLISRGIIPGIKVDTGAKDMTGFPNEKITQGLDDLAERLEEYYDMGARFCKWRMVVQIGDDIPTKQSIEANCMMLARYAILCQEAGMVPMVEPEVIHAGTHSLERAEAVTMNAIQVLFNTLREYRVDLKAVILKSSMVLAGDAYKRQSTPEEVAAATLRTFHLSVPHEVPGIVFLSGGQSPKRATENLQAISTIVQGTGTPWKISFSYSRALEEPVLTAWQGKAENTKEAQKALLYRVRANGFAQLGKYDASKDKQGERLEQENIKTETQD